MKPNSADAATSTTSPHRSASQVVRDFLRLRFGEPYLRLDARACREFIFNLPERGVTGGAVYDAVVGATAAAHSTELVSCDRKAVPTYEKLGARVVLLE